LPPTVFGFLPAAAFAAARSPAQGFRHLPAEQHLPHLRRIQRLPIHHQHGQQHLLEFGGEQRRDGLRIGHEMAVGDQAELDVVVVAQDRDADADVARLRHPEHTLIEARPGQIQGLLRAGHIGHHGAGLGGQEVEKLLLDDLRRETDGGQDAERQRRLIRALEFVHAASHCE
jgi:hypothetical protein